MAYVIDTDMFVDNMYDDTLTLVHDVRNYILNKEAQDEVLSTEIKSVVVNEVSRLTYIVTALMSLLMVHKALRAEEITIDVAKKEIMSLQSDIEARITDNKDIAKIVPEDLNTLVTDTENMLDRVKRINHNIFS